MSPFTDLIPAFIPVPLDCCFSLSMDFPRLQSHPLRPSCKFQVNKSPPCSPPTDGGSLLACRNQGKTPTCPSGPTSVGLQQISSILPLLPHVVSMIQHEIHLSKEPTTHTCLCSYPSPKQKALHLPWHHPEPQWSPGLYSHLMGEAPSPSTGVVPLGAPCFWLFLGQLPGALTYWLSFHMCICPTNL